MAFLEHLSTYNWLNQLTAYLIVPLELILHLSLMLWACLDICLTKRQLFFGYLFHIAVRVSNEWITYSLGVSASTCYRVVTVFLFSFLYLFQKEKRNWINLVQLLATMFVNDLLVSFVFAALYPADFSMPGTWVGTTVLWIPYGLIPMILTTIVFSILYHEIRTRKWVNSVTGFYFFAIVTTVIALALPFLPLSELFGPTTPFYTTDLAFLMSFIISCLLLFLVVYFSRAHYQNRQQIRENRSLQQRESIYVSLVTEQRAYRHNLMNMLYGFEAQILTSDINKIEAYYNELVRKNHVINNENIIDVQNIHSSAVRGLFLFHIEKAQILEVPFHLACEPLYSWCHIKDVDCCALLGALLDNAVEAAIRASAPFVFVSVRNEGDMLEIVLRNTFLEYPDIESMQIRGYTTKEGGGVGLDYVQGLLKKHNKMQYFVFVQGRYVVQQLLIP